MHTCLSPRSTGYVPHEYQFHVNIEVVRQDSCSMYEERLSRMLSAPKARALPIVLARVLRQVKKGQNDADRVALNPARGSTTIFASTEFCIPLTDSNELRVELRRKLHVSHGNGFL